MVLNTWGETHLRLHHLDAAETAFREALALTSEGQQEFYAYSYKGLAQVAKARHNINEARTYAEASLRAFKAIDHYEALDVQQWLDALSANEQNL